MKKGYISPELERVEFTLSDVVLGISEGESGASGGFIEEPDDDMMEE